MNRSRILSELIIGLGGISLIWALKDIVYANPRAGFYLEWVGLTWFDILIIFFQGVFLIWFGIEKFRTVQKSTRCPKVDGSVSTTN